MKCQNQGVLTMKALIIFFLFFSFHSYGRNPLHYQKMAEKRQKIQTAKQTDSSELEDLANEVQKDMQSLLFTLTHEQASEERKLEIMKTLAEMALINNEVIKALKELVARGRECEDEEEQTGCLILDIVSLKAHAELLRQKVNDLNEVEGWDQYKDIVLQGTLIVTGIGALFLPVGGPVLSTVLFTARYATLGKWTGGSMWPLGRAPRL